MGLNFVILFLLSFVYRSLFAFVFFFIFLFFQFYKKSLIIKSNHSFPVGLDCIFHLLLFIILFIIYHMIWRETKKKKYYIYKNINIKFYFFIFFFFYIRGVYALQSLNLLHNILFFDILNIFNLFYFLNKIKF